MPPKKQSSTGEPATTNGKTLSFTESETKLLLSIFRFSTTKPSPDWAKVTKDLKAASVNSCQERFRIITREYGLFTPQAPGGSATPAQARTKKTPDSCKRKKAIDEEDELDAEGTPTKKGKRIATVVDVGVEQGMKSDTTRSRHVVDLEEGEV